MGLDLLKKNVESLGIELSDIQLQMFENYYSILIERNKVMNLTAITEYDDVMLKHFVDSLALNKALKQKEIGVDLKDALNVIDVGTGAGFPGIPLKIAFNRLNMTLLDSLNKRIQFLNDVIQELSLDKINAIHGRAEDFAADKRYREKYDLCVSRAVANLATLSEYCLPYVKIGGYFIPFKSGNIEDEIKDSKRAVEMLGGRIETIFKLTLPNSDIERSFVMIKKVKQTSGKYPRKAGLPSKEPLK